LRKSLAFFSSWSVSLATLLLAQGRSLFLPLVCGLESDLSNQFAFHPRSSCSASAWAGQAEISFVSEEDVQRWTEPFCFPQTVPARRPSELLGWKVVQNLKSHQLNFLASVPSQLQPQQVKRRPSSFVKGGVQGFPRPFCCPNSPCCGGIQEHLWLNSS
jgi:hypothetical protein